MTWAWHRSSCRLYAIGHLWLRHKEHYAGYCVYSLFSSWEVFQMKIISLGWRKTQSTSVAVFFSEICRAPHEAGSVQEKLGFRHWDDLKHCGADVCPRFNSFRLADICCLYVVYYFVGQFADGDSPRLPIAINESMENSPPKTRWFTQFYHQFDPRCSES